jgi:predicted negative regulator of RcsB-dependent stress response
MPNLTRIVILFLVLFLSVRACAGQDDLGFARYLLESKEYEGAITEFERYIFMNPGTKTANLAEYEIALAYRELKELDRCTAAIRKSMRAEINDSLRTEQEIQLAVVSAAKGDFDLAEFQLIRIEVYTEYPNLKQKAAFLRGISCVYQAKWEDARQAFETAFADSLGAAEFYHLRGKVDSLALAAGRQPRKSPELAKWLSTFVPGSGQFYARDWQNGLNALAVNSATGYLLVDNLTEHDWGDALLTYLFLFGRYYYGNRYHAALSANEYNMRMDRKNRDIILGLFDESNR